jgi:hypothetical protein
LTCLQLSAGVSMAEIPFIYVNHCVAQCEDNMYKLPEFNAANNLDVALREICSVCHASHPRKGLWKIPCLPLRSTPKIEDMNDFLERRHSSPYPSYNRTTAVERRVTRGFIFHNIPGST